MIGTMYDRGLVTTSRITCLPPPHNSMWLCTEQIVHCCGRIADLFTKDEREKSIKEMQISTAQVEEHFVG